MNDLDRLVLYASALYLCFMLTHLSQQMAVIARAMRRGSKTEENK